MQLFCPACEAAFPGASRCPRCGGLLLLPHEVSSESPRPRFSTPDVDKKPTPAGRVAIGVILALGLYLGVRKLMTGTVLALIDDPAGWWLSIHGLSAVYSAQAIAVVFGGLISAAGRGRGFGYGALVGMVCGVLFLAYELLAGAPPRDLVLYLQPPVLTLLGLISGVVGARVWGVAPALNIAVPNPSKLSSIQLATDAAANSSPPTQWLRIIAGAALMVCGTAVADQARQLAQRNSAGLLHVQNQGQGQFITWQMAVFAVLFGGILAGAGTGAGLRHGLISGAIGGVGVMALCFKIGQALPPVDYWLDRFDLGEMPLTAPAVALAVIGGVFAVGVVGGWMGGALVLPLAPENMRRRLRIGGD